MELTVISELSNKAKELCEKALDELIELPGGKMMLEIISNEERLHGKIEV